jgi:arylsulfate sulfotransferase
VALNKLKGNAGFSHELRKPQPLLAHSMGIGKAGRSDCGVPGPKISNLRWRLLQLITIVGACSCVLACGSIDGPSIDSPVTSVSPTQNPLVAKYFVSSKKGGQARIEFGIGTSYGRQSAWYSLPPDASGVTILVAGMKASTTYHMRAQIRSGGTSWFDKDRLFTTGPLPSIEFPTLVVTRPNSGVLAAAENPGVELINLTEPSVGMMQAIVADRDGNPIWYYDVGADQANLPDPIKLMPNGHILVNIQNGATGSTCLREVDLAGQTIRQMNAPTLQQKLQTFGHPLNALFFHHDFLPLSNGHLIVLGSAAQDFGDLPGYPGSTQVIGDLLVDLDQDWNPVWFWSAFDHLDVNRHLMGLPDWTHSNAVVYTPSDGNLLISMRNQSWILKIDYLNGAGSGNVLWRLGKDGDFTLTGGDPSQWFYAQHFPSLINTDGSASALAIFDNGNLRILNASGTECGSSGPACYSRATIFRIDESTRMATVEWQDSPGPYSFWGGSINQLPNKDVEFDMSTPFPGITESRVLEVTQTDMPQTVWQMDIQKGYAYRAYRIPSLYPSVSWK